ncbi:MAG TPA: SGNH/GDSL hydrolase family protein [Gemmatimonadaceae bacterium]|nr:SGNH/GDSL hydrolase family protein [Gemmatimonadaceae bacterium]
MMQAPSTPAAKVRMLALGDSYTIGEGVAVDDRWPVRLAAMLRAAGVPVSAPVIIATTGWTTDELSAGIDAAKPTGPFGLVTLLIGVNNQYRGRSTEEYRTQFHALLARAIAFAESRASRVVVVSIPDWGVTPFAKRSGRDLAKITTDINAFNAIGHDEATRAGARFVDVTPMSRRAATESDLVAGDGLHPSASMYAEWARLALPVAVDAIGAWARRAVVLGGP